MIDRCPTCDREACRAAEMRAVSEAMYAPWPASEADWAALNAAQFASDAARVDCESHAVDWRAEALRLRAELAKAREVPAGVEEAIDAYATAAIANAGAMGARDEHAALTAAWNVVSTAIAREVTAAEQRGREAGRAEVLAMAPEVEAQLGEVVEAQWSTRGGEDVMRAAFDSLRAAIAAAQARAVEAARQGMRAAVDKERAEALIDYFGFTTGRRQKRGANATPEQCSAEIEARAALLAALTGEGRP